MGSPEQGWNDNPNVDKELAELEAELLAAGGSVGKAIVRDGAIQEAQSRSMNNSAEAVAEKAKNKEKTEQDLKIVSEAIEARKAWGNSIMELREKGLWRGGKSWEEEGENLQALYEELKKSLGN